MAPPDARVVLVQSVLEGDTAAAAFLQAHGYVQMRHFRRMVIDLDAPSGVPDWPGGIGVHSFSPQDDLEASIRASRDAFHDHYGFVSGSIDQEIQRTQHRIENDPSFDPSLWFLATEAGTGEIVGLCFCAPAASGDKTTGYIQTLGVRPAWRRRGLGRALLRHAFGSFGQRGTPRVALHVDAQSLTGATQLYESCGMYVDELSHEYQLELRPGIDLTATARTDGSSSRQATRRIGTGDTCPSSTPRRRRLGTSIDSTRQSIGRCPSGSDR